MRAVLRYAMVHAESSTGGPAPSLTSLLVGTAAGGTGINDSMTAILRGVLDANDALARTRHKEGEPQPRPIAAVEFLELYEDRAVEATRSLGDLAEQPRFRDRLVAHPLLRYRQGGLRRLAYQEPGGWWRRMEITVTPDESLKFTTLTERARAEVRLLPTQRKLVDRFVEQAIGSSADDESLSATLFELLVPNALKEYAPDRSDLVLIVDEQAARYPWELLRYRSDGRAQPLALQAGVLRQLAMREFEERVRSSTEPTALVIGDPPTDLPALPGARQEAEQVVKRLEEHDGRYGVVACIDKPPEETIKALYRRPYQILHLAGHGVYEHEPQGEALSSANKAASERPKVTGMVIGKGIYLTPAEVRQMQQVPDLVFINCCHLGYIESKPVALEPDRDRLAANLATQFINMGVRAVIAAGWAVDDDAAATFAAELYARMLAGETFGRAVLHARQAVRDRHPGVNTWGAYQCYGDPDFVLIRDRQGRGAEISPQHVVSPAEVVLELHNMAIAAKTASAQQRAAQQIRLGKIMSALPKGWEQQGALLGALGLAYGELGRFREAVAYCERALTAEQALFDLRLVEQLANLKVRWACQLHNAGDDKGAVEQLSEGIERLDTLLRLGETVERLSLMASAHKRRALINRRARLSSLRQMGEYYRRAHELQVERFQYVDPYPLLNWLASALILDRIGSGEDQDKSAIKAFEELITQAEAAATGRGPGDTSFWNGVAAIECDLLRCVKDNTLKKKNNRDAIVNRYQDLYARGSTREICSTYDNLRFLAIMLSADKQSGATVAALNRICDSLANHFRDCEEA
jgi:tetratricopeptide (TPR) repeat protein